MLRSRLAVACVAVLALAVPVAGCGGGDEQSAQSPTAEWADGFCTAITSWRDSLETATGDLADASSLSRESLERTADDVGAATEQLVDDLRALGAPDTESGQEVEAAIDELATTLETELTQVEETVQGISGLTGVPSALSSLSTSFSAMAAAFASSLEALENADVQGDLREALESSPACDELSS